MVELQADLFL